MYYVAKVEGVKKWDNSSQITSIIKYLEENFDKITGIELSGNSIGFDVAKELAQYIEKLSKLEIVNFRDIFVSRLKTDLPKSLYELIVALKNKNIISLDLSDNAFGPIGVASFDYYLIQCSSLKKLYVENNGLGPEGAENLAKALLSSNMRLEELRISRNRLENKGAVAISKVLLYMKSLKNLHILQNGIKEEGMIELFKSFVSNQDLEELRMNDNSMKGSAHVFVEVLDKLKNLKVIDISDLLIGDEFSMKIFTIFKSLPNLKEIYFNYNEIEKKSTQKAIFDICLDLNLKSFEIKGNEINGKLWKEYKSRIKSKIDRVTVYSDEEDSKKIIKIDEEEEEEEEIDNLGKELEKKLEIKK